ncbi:FkbM family methyltransferase [Roseomonas sp. HF4]|uniref:FkbM family methyltransferase n=1 Tax=Roseomonas sp. HF4 TaxID=2562313 RepID=UPI0010BFFA3D|nr:FkbM family methyltransferase [Roseomonas sp. HF4]
MSDHAPASPIDPGGSLIDRITARRVILERIEDVGRGLADASGRMAGLEAGLEALGSRQDPQAPIEDRLAKLGARIAAMAGQLDAVERWAETESLAATERFVQLEIMLAGLLERAQETASGRMDAALAEFRGEVTAALAGIRAEVAAPPAVRPAPPDRQPYVTTAELLAMGRVEAEAAMRARCMVVPVDATTALCRILGRYKMYVDRRDIGFAPHLMFEGFWEFWLTEFMWRNVRPGQVALDVGANHGYYSLVLADLVGAAGRVHAFEPNPRLLDLLERTVALNGFWHLVGLHGVAVADLPGPPMAFVATEAEPKNGRLLMPGEAVPDGPGTIRTDVPVLSLDEAAPGAVDFVKIDVEGAEELVWHGMQGLIARSPGIRIVMEFNPGRCRTPRETLEGIAARFPLREIGFDARACPCTVDDVLSRSEDTLLYLSDHDPA